MIKLRKQKMIILVIAILITVFSINLHVYSEEGRDETSIIIEDDFSNDTNLWNYSGNAFRSEESGYVILTNTTDSQLGELWLNEEIKTPFTAEFTYKIGGDSGVYYLNFMFGGNDHGMEFDGFQNEWESSLNHIAYINNNLTSHVITIGGIEEDAIWHNAKIIVENDSIEVYVDDVSVLYYSGHIDCIPGKLGFRAETGTWNSWHLIDNIRVSQSHEMITLYNKVNGEAISVSRREALEYNDYVGPDENIKIYNVFTGEQTECIGSELAAKLMDEHTGRWVAGDIQVILPFKNIYEERTFVEKIKLYGIAKKIPVLMYHHMLNAQDKKVLNSLIVTTEEFEKQMEYLYKNDYTTITTKELELFLENKLDIPEKSVLITFDDGYKSNYIYAYPILKKYGFKASIALIPKLMPENIEAFNPSRLNYLSWQEVVLGSDVFEYTNHTFSHASMKGVNYNRALEEIKRVEDDLQSKYFVYPIGHASSNSEKALKELSYKLAFTTREGFVTKSSNRLYLHRKRVNGGIILKSFVSLLK
jgi:peptidoglycan/xylan/chitin deacetylase (PgdA/CDA1 family)